jgi:hypothetical protein
MEHGKRELHCCYFSALFLWEEREKSPDSHDERKRFFLATISTTKQVKTGVNEFH